MINTMANCRDRPRREKSEKVQLFFDENRGRGVQATAFIEPEATLFTETPFVFALDENYRRIHCSCCCQKREKLRACGGCNFVYYCDRQCQASNYSNHQYECKYLKTAKCDIQVRTRMLLMALQKHLKQRKRSKRAIVSNTQDFPQGPEELYMKKQDASLKEKSSQEPDMDHLREFVKVKGLLITEDLIQQFVRILNVNVHTIYDEVRGEDIGEGLYPGESMFNHSCRPNCSFFHRGREMTIASIRPIKPGEECCINYVSLISPTKTRQSKLQKWYDFDCNCKRCKDIEKDRLMYAIKCPQMNCLGSVVPCEPGNSLNGHYLACDVCSHDVNNSELPDKIRQTEIEVERFWAKHENSLPRSSHDYQFLKDCAPMLLLLDTLYKPYHVSVCRFLKKAFKTSRRLHEASKAVEYGTRYLVALRTHLDVCDSLLGNTLWHVGQLQAELGMNLKATCTLKEALSSLRIAFGSCHPATLQAQELLATLSAGKETHLTSSPESTNCGSPQESSNVNETSVK